MTNALVFVVDDDPSASRGVCRLLATAGYRTEAFASAAQFLAREPSGESCCLILDMMMPGMSGLELQHQLREAHRLLPIVFITGKGDVPSSVRAMKDGAVDFLLKPFTADDLLSAVATALERGARESAEAAERAAILGRWQSLTPRERQVCALVVGGALNKQAAFRLGITEKTIKIHRAHTMEKMAAGSFAELVQMIEKIRVGPCPPPELSEADALANAGT